MIMSGDLRWPIRPRPNRASVTVSRPPSFRIWRAETDYAPLWSRRSRAVDRLTQV